MCEKPMPAAFSVEVLWRGFLLASERALAWE
jgi:hypothetical protein